MRVRIIVCARCFIDSRSHPSRGVSVSIDVYSIDPVSIVERSCLLPIDDHYRSNIFWWATALWPFRALHCVEASAQFFRWCFNKTPGNHNVYKYTGKFLAVCVCVCVRRNHHCGAIWNNCQTHTANNGDGSEREGEERSETGTITMNADSGKFYKRKSRSQNYK